MEETDSPVPIKGRICGGLTDARQVDDTSKALFEEFRDVIEQKIQSQFGTPEDFVLEPAKVRTQVVAGTNYYFDVQLPNGEFAHVKIFKPLKGHALETADRSSFVTVDKETTKD